jgi:uncharacterized protein (TIGR00251 family)
LPTAAGSAVPAFAIRDTPQGAAFAVRVQPNAKKTAVVGVLGEGENAALKLALAAPPIDGRANEAAIEFLAEIFQVPRSHIQILKGETSRSKLIRISGKTAAELERRLPSAF